MVWIVFRTLHCHGVAYSFEAIEQATTELVTRYYLQRNKSWRIAKTKGTPQEQSRPNQRIEMFSNYLIHLIRIDFTRKRTEQTMMMVAKVDYIYLYIYIYISIYHFTKEN